ELTAPALCGHVIVPWTLTLAPRSGWTPPLRRWPCSRRVASNSLLPCFRGGSMLALVTGGAGFIGSHLAERLVTLGHFVRVVDDLSTGDEANLAGIADQIEFLRGDLCEPAVCRRAVVGIDIVFHVAALPS